MSAPAKPEHARRLTLSQILELVLSRGERDRSVVTIGRNAAGDTQVEVKVRVGDSDEVATAEAAAAKARELYDQLVEVYPAGDQHDGASVSLTRNAKGDTQVEVDVRTTGAGGVVTAEEAQTKATAVYDALTGRYPLADGTARGGKGTTA